jgi:hypothetical protein
VIAASTSYFQRCRIADQRELNTRRRARTSRFGEPRDRQTRQRSRSTHGGLIATAHTKSDRGREELEMRVAKRIAACPNERIRLL